MPPNSVSIDLPTVVWLAGSGVLLLAVTGGFLAGVSCAPLLQEWMLRRACRSFRRLYEATAQQMEQCERLCRQLATWSGPPLTTADWSRLDRLTRQLHDACNSLRAAHAATVPAADTAAPPLPSVPPEWKRTPLDPATQVPDRTTLEDNLQRLLSASAAGQQPCGVLLVSIDKVEQLHRRFGSETVQALECRLATVLIKAARNEDLVCQAGPHTFAVLMPAVSPLVGARLAERLRSAVREHRFRGHDGGPEIVVTASFGFAVCSPGDPASLVLDRAGTALAKSRACGRNQLHLHDGTHPALCRVG
jgi:diguanylate cyclase (GGDEF)-like protein